MNMGQPWFESHVSTCEGGHSAHRWGEEKEVEIDNSWGRKELNVEERVGVARQ